MTTTRQTRAQRREEEFEQLALAVTPRLLRSARLLCGDAHGAEDLVQETLAKLYVRQRSALLPRLENPAAYAQTVLTRTFLSARRRRSSTELPLGELPDRLGPWGAPSPTEPEERMALLAALAELAPADRAVLVLRYLEELSVEETADRVGCTAGAVRTRCSRALGRLRVVVERSLVETEEQR